MPKKHSDVPIRIDAAGQEALYSHLVHALLHSDGEGFDPEEVEKLAGDPNVKDEHLAGAIKATCVEFKRATPELAGKNRWELAGVLASVLDEGLASGIARNPGERMVEIPVNNSKRKPDWRKRIGGGGDINFLNQRRSGAIKGTTSNVTERVLRLLRRSAGWVPSSHIMGHGNRNKSEEPALDNIWHAYIDEAMQEGLTLQQAETRCQTEYIAIVHRPSRRMDPFSGQPEASSRTNIDLSPKAAEDYKWELQRLKDLRKEVKNLSYVRKLLGPGGRDSNTIVKQAANIVNDVRTAEIQRLMREENLSSSEASKKADKTYIAIIPVRPGNHAHYRYEIHPRAESAINMAIENFKRGQGGVRSLSYVCKIWQVRRGWGAMLAKSLREQEITRLMEAESLSRQKASEKANKAYIEIGHYKLYPRAVEDFGASVQQRYPGREPREPEGSGQRSL